MLPHEPNSDELFEQLRSKLHDYGSPPPPAAWEQIQASLSSAPVQPTTSSATSWIQAHYTWLISGLIGAVTLLVLTWVSMQNASAPTRASAPRHPTAVGFATNKPTSPLPGLPTKSYPLSSTFYKNHIPSPATARQTTATGQPNLATLDGKEATVGENDPAVNGGNPTFSADAPLNELANNESKPELPNKTLSRSLARVRAATLSGAPFKSRNEAKDTRAHNLLSQKSAIRVGNDISPATTGVPKSRKFDLAQSASPPAITQQTTPAPKNTAQQQSVTGPSPAAMLPTTANTRGSAGQQEARFTETLPPPSATAANYSQTMATAFTSPTTSGPVSVNLLTPRSIPVAAATLPAKVTKTSYSPTTQTKPTLIRWSSQFSAGPALTHRRLLSSSTDSLAQQNYQNGQLERAARGQSGQFLIGYQLTPKLALQAGLGYAEYRQALRLSLVDTLTRTVRQQDSYRFLMLPVLAEYELGQRNQWQWGLNVGGVLQLYQGGRTTQGAKCLCEQVTRTASDTLFRARSLSVQFSPIVRYQVSLRSQLQARPYVRYMITSLRQPTAATLPKRYLWAVGLELGYSIYLW